MPGWAWRRRHPFDPLAKKVEKNDNDAPFSILGVIGKQYFAGDYTRRSTMKDIGRQNEIELDHPSTCLSPRMYSPYKLFKTSSLVDTSCGKVTTI
mmetsp:Transcript_32180/g.47825  ORF Transcript_32180/g.47825 Transcript_32180/m.47825 type:complete len:95 (-) Transcript_32180:387-671(-)